MKLKKIKLGDVVVLHGKQAVVCEIYRGQGTVDCVTVEKNPRAFRVSGLAVNVHGEPCRIL